MKNLYLVVTNRNKYLIAASDRYTVFEATDVNNTMSFGESIESVVFICVAGGDFTEGQVLKVLY